METSQPDIFAVGECVEHNGICYGLVAPLFEQGKVLAATITGNKGPTYHRDGAGRQAQDHGRRRLLGGRLRADAAAPSRCATRIRRSAFTRSCSSATATGWRA